MKSLNTLTGDALEQMIDYKVVDQTGASIGTLHSLWSDPTTGAVEFLGVKTGWLFGHNHVVPAEKAELDDANSVVRLPYTEIFIKEAPSMSADAEISEVEEDDIFRYYGLPRRSLSGASEAAGVTGTSSVPLAAANQDATGSSDAGTAIPSEDLQAQNLLNTDRGEALANVYRLRKTARPTEPSPVAAFPVPMPEEIATIGGMTTPTNDDFINGGAAAITTGEGSGTHEAVPAAGGETYAGTEEERPVAATTPSDNADPLTGEHGAHPVGTGVGAISAGAAGMAIGAAVGGPIGAVIGGIAGAVGGGLAGKGLAESVNPTEESGERKG